MQIASGPEELFGPKGSEGLDTASSIQTGRFFKVSSAQVRKLTSTARHPQSLNLRASTSFGKTANKLVTCPCFDQRFVQENFGVLPESWLANHRAVNIC